MEQCCKVDKIGDSGVVLFWFVILDQQLPLEAWGVLML